MDSRSEPSTDQVLQQRRAIERAFAGFHVSGLDAAVAAAEVTDIAATGPDARSVAEFCRLWIGTPNVVTVFSQVVNQSSSGTDKVGAILNCQLATGRIGRRGCGPFSVTGQPNAMGEREVGGLANALCSSIARHVPRGDWRAFWA